MNANTTQLLDIFMTASAIPDANLRQAYLDCVCSEDGVLRREVEQLLATRAPAENFFTDMEAWWNHCALSGSDAEHGS